MEATMPPEVAEAARNPVNLIGRYVLLGLVGKGGMGEVHRAWDRESGAFVALKVLTRVDEENVARFQREAETARPLDHPNIARVLDVGRLNGRPYIAMRFVDGETLQSCKDLKRGVAAVRDAARALAYAHGMGVIHRDVTPRNILVDREGRGTVTDFGLARTLGVGATLTESGLILGTPSYLPPEQAAGERTDERSDVYGLGAVLYHVATQSAPFYGEDALQVLNKVRTAEVVPPRRLNPEVTPDLERIILVALQKDPRRRFAGAKEMAEDLDRFLEGRPVRARPPGPVLRTLRRIGGWGATVAGLMLALAGVVVWRATTDANIGASPEVAKARLALCSETVERFRGEVRPSKDTISRYEMELSGRASSVSSQEFPEFTYAAILEQGRFYTEAGRQPQAIKFLDALLSGERPYPPAFLHRGRARFRQYSRLRARLLVDAAGSAVANPLGRLPAIEESPEAREVRDAARQDLNSYLVRADAATPEAAYAGCVLAFLDGDWAKARERAGRAVGSPLLSEDASLILALALTYEGDHESAAAALEKVPAHRDALVETRLWIVGHLVLLADLRNLGVPLARRTAALKALAGQARALFAARQDLEHHPLLEGVTERLPLIRWLQSLR